jgi:hypothetical protein
MKLARVTSLIVLSLIIAVACNTKSVKKDAGLPDGVKEQHQTVYISPGQYHEECVELYPDQVLNYLFIANKALDFNIHYHSMEGRKYAVQKEGIKSFSGKLVVNEMKFYSKDQESFCMIWSNTKAFDARLNLKYYITSSAASGDTK